MIKTVHNVSLLINNLLQLLDIQLLNFRVELPKIRSRWIIILVKLELFVRVQSNLQIPNQHQTIMTQRVQILRYRLQCFLYRVDETHFEFFALSQIVIQNCYELVYFILTFLIQLHSVRFVFKKPFCFVQ